jgi:dTDP-glucose 4,6-dehydratase/UDP-glucose 4-epimerase
MKVLIIGSQGFIGSNLLEHYRATNAFDVYHCDVLQLKNDDTYCHINSENPNFESIFKNNQFDVCINASGIGNVSMSLINPLNDFILNTYNVIKILESIRIYNSNCKFLNISSAAVYGSPNKLPIAENHNLNPLSPYGHHKLISEQICQEYYTLFNIQTCNLRVFSAYGNGLKKQLFWDTYQKLKSEDAVIEFFGTGMETRDFIHIDDLIQAINLVIIKGKFNSDYINVASGIESSIKDVTNQFLDFFPLKKKTVFNNQVKKGDPLNWKADISYLISLGFTQKISISEGLLKYSKWLQEKK